MTTTTNILDDWETEKTNRNRVIPQQKFEVIKVIANAEYRADRDYKDYKNSEYKESEKLFNTLGDDVQIVIVKCAHSDIKHHFFAFGSDTDINRPLYRQTGKHTVREGSMFKKFAVRDGLISETENHYYDIWHDWETSGHGWTEPEQIAIDEVKKYRRQEAAKQRQVSRGDIVEFHANQAWREGMVLATIDRRALIAYRMPQGAVYMVLVDHDPDVSEAKRGLGYERSDPFSSCIKAHRYNSNYQSMSAKALAKHKVWGAKVRELREFKDSIAAGLEYLSESL